MRRFEEADQGFIKRLTTCRIHETLKAKEVWCRIEELRSNEDTQYFERVGAAYSDNADATAAGRSGQGNNGISMDDSHGTSA